MAVCSQHTHHLFLRSQHRCILKELQYIVNERRMLDDDGSPLLEQSLLDLDQSAATKVHLRALVLPLVNARAFLLRLFAVS